MPNHIRQSKETSSNAILVVGNGWLNHFSNYAWLSELEISRVRELRTAALNKQIWRSY
jgi:hypothetical protein